MIEVPLTRDPPFSTSTDTLSGRRLTKVTNLALARACRPRWLVISTVSLFSFKHPPPAFPTPPRYISAPLPSRRSPPRGVPSSCPPFQVGPPPCRARVVQAV